MKVTEIIEKLVEENELEKIINTAKSKYGCIYYGVLFDRRRVIINAKSDILLFKKITERLKEENKTISDLPAIMILHHIKSAEFLKSIILTMLTDIEHPEFYNSVDENKEEK
jgi:hypothetical protein